MMKHLFIMAMLMEVVNGVRAQTWADSANRQVNVHEVIIASGKFEEPKNNTSQQAIVIHSSAIRNLNAQRTGEVLMNSGAAFVQMSQQGGGSVVLRGFEASRVLYVVDGVRMNNILYRSGHLQNIITVDNNVLDRVEVLYGPSSTVYGSDALGGVVHLRTKNPVLSGDKKFLSTGSGMFRYGSVNNEFTGHVDVSMGCKKIASLTSATFSRFGDLRMGKYVTQETSGMWNRDFYQARTNRYDSTGTVIGQKDTAIANPANHIQVGSGYWQYDLLQKFLIQQTKSISHTINLQLSNSSDVPRYDRLAVTSPTTVLRNAEWYYGPQFRAMASYQMVWKNTGLLDAVQVNINYQNIVESRYSRLFNSAFRTERKERVNVLGMQADLRKQINRHTIYAGADVQVNFLKSMALARNIDVDTVRPASTRYPDGGNNMNYIGFYFTHQYRLRKQLTVSNGIRYNLVTMNSTLSQQSALFYPLPYSSISNRYHGVAGNASLNFTPGMGFRMVTLFSTGFRAPNVDDMSKIFESVKGRVIVPNKNLRPEYTLNGELTIEKSFSERNRVSATGFYTYFLNAINTDAGQLNGADSIVFDGVLSKVVTLVNKDRAYIAGLTATAEADVTGWLSLFGSVTYTYGRILTDTTPYPLDHIPPWYGRAGFRANYKWTGVEFFTVFNGAKLKKDYNMFGEDNFAQGTGTDLPGWYTLNARITLQPFPYFSVTLGCDNLLDLRYRHFASGISAPGRNLFATVRVHW